MPKPNDRHTPDEKNLFYTLSDDDTATPDSKQEMPRHAPTRNPLILLMKLIGTPVEGWKVIRRSTCTSASFAWGGFYPIVLTAALSNLAKLIFDAEATVAGTVAGTVIIFMSLLLGNFCSLLCCSLFLPSSLRSKFDTRFGRIFFMAILSVIALTVVFWNILPPIQPLLSFIPIYVIYLIVRGVKYLRIPSDISTRMTILLSLLTIGLPFLFNTIFSSLI